MLNNLKETQNDHMKYYNEVLCDCKLKVTTVRNTTGGKQPGDNKIITWWDHRAVFLITNHCFFTIE